jgi:hypothetical protein
MDRRTDRYHFGCGLAGCDAVYVCRSRLLPTFRSNIPPPSSGRGISDLGRIRHRHFVYLYKVRTKMRLLSAFYVCFVLFTEEIPSPYNTVLTCKCFRIVFAGVCIYLFVHMTLPWSDIGYYLMMVDWLVCLEARQLLRLFAPLCHTDYRMISTTFILRVPHINVSFLFT